MPDQLRLISESSPDYETEAEAARREVYSDRLRAYLQDPDFRATEGFPIGEDEDILALSDPPYYTACPNPFLSEILEQWQAERVALRAELGLPEDANGGYHREPFASDVSEGKGGAIYNAHSYHTKVPYKAIMRYILHYTEPGDVVFDGFCGTGMTGVAAQLCGDRQEVQALGYRVAEDGTLYEGDKAVSRLGARKAALVDLSPAATFIAYNYNTPVDAAAFEREAKRILREVDEECGWMYETWHPHCDDPNRVKAKINYTVWSDVFACSECGGEIVFWDAAVDQDHGLMRKEFPCPHCGALQSKRGLDHAWETIFESALSNPVRHVKQVPVLINYSVEKKRHEKRPDAIDLELIRRIEESSIPYWFPVDRMPPGDESRRNDDIGMMHTHQFYTSRNLWTLAAVWKRSTGTHHRWLVFAVMQRANKQHQIAISRVGGEKKNAGGKTAGHRRGTLYVPSNQVEFSVFELIRKRLRVFNKISTTTLKKDWSAITTQSSCKLNVPSASVDYVFVDPPFGANIMYSELNFLWEAWLQIFTKSEPEVVVNKSQRKDLLTFQNLIAACFLEFNRILKPGRWMTVEFHNSQNAVWNAIQEALQRAGFVIADVRTLDKKKKTHTQVTAAGAPKQDLIISAYKPNGGLEARFAREAGTPEGAWDFVQQHLGRLPCVVTRPDGALEVLAERQDYLLFDRMVAFHIQRGATVPLSAPEFYAGLRQRFVERDTMFFLPEQVAAYDRARLAAESVAQLALFVDDEKSAVQWLRQQLDPQAGGQPQTYQDLQPQFLQQLHQASHEELPELREMLEQNFLQDEADRWYVPDPNKASDLEQLRRKALLREFKSYVEGQGRLRKIRTEAIRVGFGDAWQCKDYAVIVQVAERLDDAVLQEDPELLMYYDNAGLRVT